MAAVSRNVIRFGGIFTNRAQNTGLIRTSGRCSALSVYDKNNTSLSSDNSIASVCLIQHRTFLPGLPNPFSKNAASKKLEYSERRVLGYTMEQMYEIVAEVEKYNEFVPWVKQSVVDQHRRRPGHFKCKLTVGFPPLVERYTSIVTTSRPHLVRSEATEGFLFHYLLTQWRFSPGLQDRNDTCTLDFTADCSDGKIFTSLINQWRFSPGVDGNPKTCTIVFSVQFEFRNQLHSHVARMFFDEIVRTMVNAFLKRAEELHGPQSIRPRKKKILAYSTSS